VATEDLVLILWGHSRIVEVTRPVRPDIWRRYLGLMLDALRPANAHPLPVPALQPIEVAEAMALQGRRDQPGRTRRPGPAGGGYSTIWTAPDGQTCPASRAADPSSPAGLACSTVTRPSSSWSNTPGAVSAHSPAPMHTSRSAVTRIATPFAAVTR
jgi:hypothetical protein